MVMKTSEILFYTLNEIYMRIKPAPMYVAHRCCVAQAFQPAVVVKPKNVSKY